MKNFRSHKNNIISSKRDSQKLQELQLLQFSQLYSLGRINHRLGETCRQQLHKIKQEHYKIVQGKNGCTVERNISDRKKVYVNLRGLEQEERMSFDSTRSTKSHYQVEQNSATYSKQTESQTSQSDILGKILEVMTNINELQQERSAQQKTDSPLTSAINSKISQFKQLINSIEGRSRSKMFDFYNEEEQEHGSPSSFNSRNSEESINENTDRNAYEMTQSRAPEEIEIKYRRIDRMSSTQEDDTFLEEEEEQSRQQGSPIMAYEEQEHSQSVFEPESSIIHLFSYSKENHIQSGLSSITEHSSEYHEPDSKNMTLTNLSDQDLQFKKIHYLLETTQKKNINKDVSTTSRHQASDFTVENKSSRSQKSTVDGRDRSRCHNQLKDMINLLQTKYNRTINTNSENFMDALNAAASSCLIRPRQRK